MASRGRLPIGKFAFSAPPPLAFLGFARVVHASRKPAGMVAERRYTIHIDLCQSNDQLLAKMRSNLRREVRQAEQLGFAYEESVSREEFSEFFDVFANKKGLAPYDSGEKLLFTRTRWNGRVTTYHAYELDPRGRIARLRHSASVRLEEGVDPASVAMINKRHHFLDMLMLKDRGYQVYDFGGCQDPAVVEPSPLHFFKMGFGGVVVEDWQAKSLLLVILEKLNGIGRRL